ncbi:MAG: GHKL domain-containing protein [Clostridiales bacterium]|nr:GHKL domain-containing protein [Clostridiales bacterium]
MKRTPQTPEVNKNAIYAIVINSVQLMMLLLFVLYVMFGDLSGAGRVTLQWIALTGAVMAGWGAAIDIYDAVAARRISRKAQQLQTINSQMDQLNLEMRAQRHDFVSHIQVVYSLLQMEENQEAIDYLEKIYSQLQTVNRVLRTKMTAFNALLQVKSAAAEKRGIHMEMDIRTTMERLGIPPWELCCVVGNLLDNAMDAAAFAAEPYIHLTATETLSQITLRVENNGATIPAPIRARLFEPGVTTKGENHGMGLSIVQKTLDQYGGTIAAEAGEHFTAFTITLPRVKQNEA